MDRDRGRGFGACLSHVFYVATSVRSNRGQIQLVGRKKIVGFKVSPGCLEESHFGLEQLVVAVEMANNSD